MSALTVIDSKNHSLIGVNLRSAPSIAPNTIVRRLPPGERLTAAEGDAAGAGQPGQWVRVLDAAGNPGYVLGQFLRSGAGGGAGEDEPVQFALVVVNPDIDVFAAGGLAMRETAPNGHILARPWPGVILTSLESAAETAAKCGVQGQWLRVKDAQGRQGAVAAWHVRLRGAFPPEVVAQAVVVATSDARLFDAPAANSPSAWSISAGTPLYVTELGNWPAKVGAANQFIRVRSFAFKEGHVSGALLALPGSVDARARVADAALPFGDCAWLYGLHDPFDRGLFTYSGKTGWVLFTERVASGTGNAAYREWSESSYYGVIARLNNDYGGTGTIPVPSEYDRFAAQCAAWVQKSPGCHIWVIGNEMNNPREWPEEGRRPDLMITPENYADCFNRVRAAIKAAQPGAVVVPGAVDPFQGPSVSSLDWFRRMLAGIQELDGIALHCYTHGYAPDLVTDLARFQDDPLRWQYYHFRCYTPFLDVIPPLWRNRPVYITETNPTGAQPWSGGQNGWTPAAYAEIDRWNRQPFSQQIQSLVLYRWSRDDLYSISDKPGVQNDIRSTVQATDYRWRK